MDTPKGALEDPAPEIFSAFRHIGRGEDNEFLEIEKNHKTIKNASSEKILPQHRDLDIYSEHELNIGI